MTVGGARPPPLITFTITSKVAVYAPAEWADTITLFHLYQYICTLWLLPLVIAIVSTLSQWLTEQDFCFQWMEWHSEWRHGLVGLIRGFNSSFFSRASQKSTAGDKGECRLLSNVVDLDPNSVVSEIFGLVGFGSEITWNRPFDVIICTFSFNFELTSASLKTYILKVMLPPFRTGLKNSYFFTGSLVERVGSGAGMSRKAGSASGERWIWKGNVRKIFAKISAQIKIFARTKFRENGKKHFCFNPDPNNPFPSDDPSPLFPPFNFYVELGLLSSNPSYINWTRL